MSVTENSYGFLKRFDYVAETIATYRPASVLDIGCGTGNNLSAPLAEKFPNIKFIATDADKTSINYAQQNNTDANIKFLHKETLDFTEKFDLIILSEVLEHIDAPEAFLTQIRSLMSNGGKILITTPNGYGPFEITAFLESIFYLLMPNKKNINNKDVSMDRDTLAVSPHVNFFSFGQFTNLMRRAGFKIIKYKPRTFLCGYIFDRIIVSPKAIEWNCRVADRLPAVFASDWMFVLEKNDPDTRIGPYQRNLSGRVRRDWNKKRFNI